MKVLGLITEYNPFHNGHAYHLQKSREISGADYVICVMSGNFIQRGEPAIVNKWARAEMALLSGIDLVIELPVVYAMASAEYFAYGAVKILNDLQIVDAVCFGSENGRLDELQLIAEILLEEAPLYKDLLKHHLDNGISYPAARQCAIVGYCNKTYKQMDNIEKIMGRSNNILGIEYLKALKKLKSNIQPLTIARVSNAYNAEQLTGSVSSATSIRKHISSLNTFSCDATIKNSLPKTSCSILEREFKCGRGPVFSHHFQDIILAFLRKMTNQQLKSLPYISEGLQNRIKEASSISGTLDELIENICTRRYTRTRIQRILFNVLTGITASELNRFNTYGGPQYARVLGFNQKGRYLLSRINRSAVIPIVVKTANFKNSCNPLFKRMLEIESLATDIYVLGYRNPEHKKAGQDFTQNIVMLK